jgi:DeoR family glycerol-3-phosphate regulon repressor
VIGASAIDQDGTLLDFDFREVKVAQAIIETARETILVADSIKFSRKAPVRIGHLEQIDVFVTDEMPSPQIVDICDAAGVRLEVTSPHIAAETISA